MNRWRAALLRLAPPWRRRHPIHVGGVTEADRVRWMRLDTSNTTGALPMTVVSTYYLTERDPTDEAGA